MTDTHLPLLHSLADRHGFIVLGIAAADSDPQLAQDLNAFLHKGYHGEMGWLATTRTRRAAPQAMWDGAKSAIVLGVNYTPDHDPMANLTATSRGNISVYARGADYHRVIKSRLKQVAAGFAKQSRAEVKVFIDTAPLMEKPLAAKAGIGWQGKHTNLVSRQHGSWLFLAVILTDAVLPAATPAQDHCGSCTRCLDVCPTAAMPAPYQLDARRCISYLTIEYGGVIAEEFRQAMGNRIFGCDDCLAVCPWNRFAVAARETKLAANATMPSLAELLALDEGGFRAKFARTAVKRTGFTRFMRNVLIAAGNSGDANLIPHITPHLSAASPLLRGMAVWASRQLLARDDFMRLAETHAHSNEADAQVRAEWQVGLG